jgi:hypothetical protein
MRVVFSRHSLLKLGQRHISREKVIDTVREPDYVFPSYADRKAAYKKFGKLYLKVIFKREKGIVIVICQHWEEKFKPPTIL